MKLRNDAGACRCKGKLNTGYFGTHVVHRAPCHQSLRMVNSTQRTRRSPMLRQAREMTGVSEQTSELPAGKTCGRAAQGTHAR